LRLQITSILKPACSVKILENTHKDTVEKICDFELPIGLLDVYSLLFIPSSSLLVSSTTPDRDSQIRDRSCSRKSGLIISFYRTNNPPLHSLRVAALLAVA